MLQKKLHLLLFILLQLVVEVNKTNQEVRLISFLEILDKVVFEVELAQV
jgi:hypothetical protein